MRFSSLLVTALFATVGLAAPLAIDDRDNTLSYGLRNVIDDTTHLTERDIQYEDLDARAPGLRAVARPLVGGFTAASRFKSTSQYKKIEKMFHSSEPDSLLLYSGPQGESYKHRAEKMAADKNLKTMEKLVKPGAAPGNWKIASHIVAKGASGQVSVLLPTKPAEPHKNSVFAKIEYPTLVKNPKVSSIVRLNPDNDLEEVIHQKSGSTSRTPAKKQTPAKKP